MPSKDCLNVAEDELLASQLPQREQERAPGVRETWCAVVEGAFADLTMRHKRRARGRCGCLVGDRACHTCRLPHEFDIKLEALRFLMSGMRVEFEGRTIDLAEEFGWSPLAFYEAALRASEGPRQRARRRPQAGPGRRNPAGTHENGSGRTRRAR